MKVDLYLTPFPFEQAAVDNKSVVVIDVLRSSTSTCAALMAGARGVIPTAGPGEAAEMWTRIGADMAVLAGERNNQRIENFQLGNSPSEFTTEAVGGKYVVMTTTNGTAIFGKAQKAALVLCGGIVNVSSVAAHIAHEKRDLLIVCAGNDGGFSIEDTLCAGMLIHILSANHKTKVQLNDAGSLALLLCRTNQSALDKTVSHGEHGRRLTSDGFGKDVAIATATDSMPVLPILVDGRLVAQEIK
ncbi:MAG: 2-phosphosulfolactate phosphatase [candidate division Zixibacteria bacterium]|nr:2-phosphosulfolactate phosphatase [candidate division Zixibacteria bacterium]